jgi:hypothetical protein
MMSNRRRSFDAAVAGIAVGSGATLGRESVHPYVK